MGKTYSCPFAISGQNKSGGTGEVRRENLENIIRGV